MWTIGKQHGQQIVLCDNQPVPMLSIPDLVWAAFQDYVAGCAQTVF